MADKLKVTLVKSPIGCVPKHRRTVEALGLKKVNTENNIWSAMNPTISAYENGAYIEYSDNEAWRKLMTRVDDGLPPYEDEKRNANDGGTLDGTVRDNS